MKSWITDYIAAQHRALDTLDLDMVAAMIETLRAAVREDRQVFVCGNGGSAANASHFATDLGKSSSDKLPKRFRVLSLTDNTPWITALGNDYSYADIFERQLMNYARAGDVLLAISVSGDSPNVVKALAWARENGVKSMVLVGQKRGASANLGEQVLVVGDTHYGRVEDVQMNILHLLCYAFVEKPELAA
ncbi:MAG: SIS domain-containing protein [Chthoniobacteraceae bacterium]